MTELNTWLQFSTPHLKDLAGHTLLGNTKFFVTNVPFFSLLAGALSVLEVRLSVESVVSLFAIGLSFMGSGCGICAGAGIGVGGVGWFGTSSCLSLTVSRLLSTLRGTLIPTGTKAEFSAVMSFSGITSLPKLSKASIATLVSSLLAGFVIVEDSFCLVGWGW